MSIKNNFFQICCLPNPPVEKAPVLAHLKGQNNIINTHDGRLNAHEDRFEAHDGELHNHYGRLEAHDGELYNHYGRLQAQEERINAQDDKMNTHNERLDMETERLSGVNKQLTTHEEILTDYGRMIQNLQDQQNNRLQGEALNHVKQLMTEALATLKIDNQYEDIETEMPAQRATINEQQNFIDNQKKVIDVNEQRLQTFKRQEQDFNRRQLEKEIEELEKQKQLLTSTQLADSKTYNERKIVIKGNKRDVECDPTGMHMETVRDDAVDEETDLTVLLDLIMEKKMELMFSDPEYEDYIEKDEEDEEDDGDEEEEEEEE